MNDAGELSAPAIYNGVMYVINGKWTFAHRRRDRQADLAHAGGDRAGRDARRDLRRVHQRRADALQRQALSRDHRQSHRRARHEDRQGGLEAEIRRLARGLLRHRRADHRQRRADLGNGRRRVDHARLPRRLGSGNREEAVAPIHHPGARRSPAPRPGRRTATPGRAAAGRPGARARTIRSSTWSIGAPAMPSRTIRGRAGPWTASTRRA